MWCSRQPQWERDISPGASRELLGIMAPRHDAPGREQSLTQQWSILAWGVHVPCIPRAKPGAVRQNSVRKLPMDTQVGLCVEVAGCPTICQHCWAQGVPYPAMPVADITHLLEQASAACAAA